MHKTPFELEEYADEQLGNIQCNGEIIRSVKFRDCLFLKCTFKEVHFNYCLFENCTFQACDLSLMRVQESTFIQTSFKDCNLIGVNWTEADWIKRGILEQRKINFGQCNLNYSIFIGLDMKGWQLSGCSIKEAIFEEADLTEADCSDSNFLDSRFVRTNLTKANFTNASNYTINANLNTLHKTKFSIPEAISLLHSLDIILVE